MIYGDFIECGHRIFGLHGAKNGVCDCGNDACSALFKHPIAANWQHTPIWSDEQIEAMEMSGQLDTGYGVLVAHGLLVVDVDARNGGVESYQRLIDAVPETAGAGLIVETGSGGGSKHLYFTVPADAALRQHLDDYKGIDFKSSGFVVGPGSLHASGRRYEVLVGSVADIAPAPHALIDLLRKPDRVRASVGGAVVDISDSDIADMLAAIDPDCDHETWYRAGMAIHDATGGTGFSLWQQWSARGTKYPGHDQIERRWHSFGKATNPVTIGTLVHYAEQAGWRRPVTFEDHTEWGASDVTLDTASVDLLRPPGFVGDIAAWINSQSIFPRENLAVAAALMAVSNIAGMRYYDPLDNAGFNLFCFGVADSSTGKESILQSHNEILKAAGVAAALHGGMKSEQEVYRNLIRHQAAYYVIDELGEQLAKIQNARAKGGATYLEGLIGTLMSIYSKSNSFAAITGDLKDEVRNSLNLERQRLQKKIDSADDTDGRAAMRIKRLDDTLAKIDMGIEHPFLSIFGLTTPERFDALMDYDMVANGFMARSLIFREFCRNPRIKPRDKRCKKPLPDSLRFALINLYSPGEFDMMLDRRVERVGDKIPIQTTVAALAMLDEVGERFWQMAEDHRESTGLHPIPRRGYELVAKISATLGIAEGLRTVEHVAWAYALVMRDVDAKMRLAHSNHAVGTADALASKILAYVGDGDGESMRSIKRHCSKAKGQDIEQVVARLAQAGALVECSPERHGPGRPTAIYKSAPK